MSHSLPVIYMPVERRLVPDDLSPNGLALEVFHEFWPDRVKYGMRMNVSRNWWHQHALAEICDNLGIEGLEFIHEVAVCVEGQDLRHAAEALDQLLLRIADGWPLLGNPDARQYDQFSNLHEWKGNEEKPVSPAAWKQAMADAQPTDENSNYGEIGIPAIISLFTFVKSLRAAIGEALAQDY